MDMLQRQDFAATVARVVQSRSVQTIPFPAEDNANVSSAEESAIRIDILQRLAEQAMTDADFRDAATDDLPAALIRYGYDLTAQELALVMRFRRSLEDAGVDLDLVDGMGDDRLAQVLESLQRHARTTGRP